MCRMPVRLSARTSVGCVPAHVLGCPSTCVPLARPPARGAVCPAASSVAHVSGLSAGFAVFAAFAAAFSSCLCARTFDSDSGPVMSATERKDLSSP